MAKRDSGSEWNTEAVKTVWQLNNGGVLTMGNTVNQHTEHYSVALYSRRRRNCEFKE